MMSKKKIFILLLLASFCLAKDLLLTDFDTLQNNLKVMPKSPPLVMSLYKTNAVGQQGQALRIMTKYAENQPILQYDLKNGDKYLNAEAYPYLNLYVKSDTGSELEIAFADKNNLAPFEPIANYLPGKTIKENWQKVVVKLNAKILNLKEMNTIYFKIVTNKNKPQDIIYLDNLLLTDQAPLKQPELKNPALILYNFDHGPIGRFKAQPQAISNKPAQLSLLCVPEGHYGPEGQALEVAFNTLEKGKAEVFIPIVNKDFIFNAANYENISFMLKANPNLKFETYTVYQSSYNAAKNYYPYYDYIYELTTPDQNWHKITIPLNTKAEKSKLIGIRILIPALSSGVFYLDDIALE